MKVINLSAKPFQISDRQVFPQTILEIRFPLSSIEIALDYDGITKLFQEDIRYLQNSCKEFKITGLATPSISTLITSLEHSYFFQINLLFARKYDVDEFEKKFLNDAYYII